jgi:hypothetical protein
MIIPLGGDRRHNGRTMVLSRYGRSVERRQIEMDDTEQAARLQDFQVETCP